MDRPDVPVAINLCRTVANILLDFMFLSTFRIKGIHPTVNTQITIRMICNGIGSLSGLVYLAYITRQHLAKRRLQNTAAGHQSVALAAVLKPSVSAFMTLARPGLWTFLESLLRNALYLWLIHGIVALGSDYATAWGVFNTIRWGLVMVPVASLEATASTFVGHEWNLWRTRMEGSPTRAATWTDLIGPRRLLFGRESPGIIRPALRSVVIALIVEVPLCIFFSFFLALPFAEYISGSPAVAAITAHMWRTIDWCYIFYALSTQFATILVATRPKWYLVNSALVNLFWVLPWAIVLQVGIKITESTAWRFHAIIFGGSLVISFCVTLVTVCLWAWRLMSKR